MPRTPSRLMFSAALFCLTLALATSSTAAHASAERPNLATRDFIFVAHAGEPLVVLNNGLEGARVAGTPRRLPGDAPATYAPLPASRLSQTERAWLGRSLRLHDARGPVCDARIRELGVWTRMEDTVTGADGKPDRQFDHTALVARIDTLSGDCKQARFARDAARPAAVSYTRDRRPPPKALRERAMKATRALRTYAATQKTYLAQAPAPRAATWERDQSASVKTELFRDRAGRAAFVSVAIQSGQGCGEWSGQAWVLYEVRADGRLTLRSADAETHAAPNTPSALLDLGDGQLYVLDGQRLYAHGRAPAESARSMEKPYMGCGC